MGSKVGKCVRLEMAWRTFSLSRDEHDFLAIGVPITKAICKTNCTHKFEVQRNIHTLEDGCS